MTRRLSALVLASLVLAVTPAAARQPRADEPKGPTIPADGTEVFQYLLDRAKIQPVKASEVRNLGKYDNVIVIILGDPGRGNFGEQLTLANNVIRSGGAALIASDSSVNLANAFRHSGASFITGTPASGGRDTNEKSLFMGRPNLPFVVPLPQPANAGGAQWELFKDLTRIATNRPSYILSPEPRGELAAPLATYPDDCVVQAPNGLFQPVHEERHFFALGGSGAHPDTLRDCRFLALADPSVFINQMMLADDPANGRTDNLEFAARAVGFLAGEDGRRTRCLFYQNGEIVERFDTLRSMMRPPLPMPNIWAMQEKLTDLGNKVIDHFETNDTANKAFVGSGDAERNRRFKFIMQFVLAMLCARAGWYLVKRIWISRRKPDGPSAVVGGLPPTSPGDRPAGVFDRRQRELLRRNNLSEPIRTLIREMFAEANAPTDAGKKLPKVVISDVVSRPETLREALTDLWKIAHGPPRVVTVQRWNLLEPLFERIRTAHAEGKWRFVERDQS